MTGDKVKQLEKLCRPVIRFLQDNYSPHETVIITDGGFKLTSDIVGMPYKNKTPFDDMVGRMIERSRN